VKGLPCNIPLSGNNKGNVNNNNEVVILKLSLGLSIISHNGIKISKEK
jgi:hypothetical protein